MQSLLRRAGAELGGLNGQGKALRRAQAHSEPRPGRARADRMGRAPARNGLLRILINVIPAGIVVRGGHGTILMTDSSGQERCATGSAEPRNSRIGGRSCGTYMGLHSSARAIRVTTYGCCKAAEDPGAARLLLPGQASARQAGRSFQARR
jgi:hypothetical protein